MLNAATHLLMRMITALLVDMNIVSGSLGQRKIIRIKDEYFVYMLYKILHLEDVLFESE